MTEITSVVEHPGWSSVLVDYGNLVRWYNAEAAVLVICRAGPGSWERACQMLAGQVLMIRRKVTAARVVLYDAAALRYYYDLELIGLQVDAETPLA